MVTNRGALMGRLPGGFEVIFRGESNEVRTGDVNELLCEGIFCVTGRFFGECLNGGTVGGSAIRSPIGRTLLGKV